MSISGMTSKSRFNTRASILEKPLRTHGEFEIELPAGDYTFEIHRGPEYRRIQGSMEVGTRMTC